jgi:hypothetical protein
MFVAEAVFIAMVAIVSSYRVPAACFQPGTPVRKARWRPFNCAEKTGLTRAARIAAEWHSAELRYLAQLMLGYRANIGGKGQESKHGGRSKSDRTGHH